MQKIRVRCRKGDTVLYIKMLKWRTFEMQELKDAEKQIPVLRYNEMQKMREITGVLKFKTVL